MAYTLGCNSTLNECSMTLATLQNSVMVIVYCRVTPRMLFETHPIAESARAYLSVPPPLHAWASCVRAAVSTTTAFSESVETPNSIFNLQEQTHQFVKQASAPSFSGDTSWHSLHRSTSARSALKHTVSVDFPISTDFYPKHVWWMSVNLSATCCNTYIYICVT